MKKIIKMNKKETKILDEHFQLFCLFGNDDFLSQENPIFADFKNIIL